MYATAADGSLEFRALSRLSTTDVADALQVARARTLAYLERRNVIHIDAEADVLRVDDALAEREPALAQLAAAAVSGLAPAGPELRRRPVEIAFDGRTRRDDHRVALRPRARLQLARCHARRRRRRGGTRSPQVRLRPQRPPRSGPSVPPDPPFAPLFARSRSLQYILRPPLATERLLPGPDGLVRIALKRPFSDGTVAIDLDPLSLLCRLAATVPPPRFHTVRYAGVLASASKWRPLIVPKPAPSADDHAHTDAPDSCGPPPPCETTGSRYRPWAELLKRTFGIDVETCPRCGGRMRLLALITEPPNVARFLRHLGEPTEPPPRAPARDPPYWQSRVLRRRHHERSGQIGLFDEH